MDKEMQDSFAMFYGMSQSLKGLVEPVDMGTRNASAMRNRYS